MVMLILLPSVSKTSITTLIIMILVMRSLYPSVRDYIITNLKILGSYNQATTK